MSSALTIFAVDDDPMVLDIYAIHLGDEFRLQTFASAEACAAALAEAIPDMILLDIEMPGMDGFSYCRTLKDADATRAIPVVFVSAHDTIAERLAGYDAGAEDFIVKPFAPEELLRKVRVTEQGIANRRALNEQLEMSEKLSSLALASMDESGLVLQFMSKLIGWDKDEDIAEGLLALMERYGLTGAVQTRTGSRRYTVSRQGVNLPLEVSVLDHVQDMGTIFEFRSRGVYNYARATAMVSNMPTHDPEFCGRIRDNLATAVAGASARLEAMTAQETLGETLIGIRDTLAAIRTFHDNSRSETSMLLFELDEQLAKAFVSLGLTSGQEASIDRLIKGFTERLTTVVDQGDGILGSLQALSDKLGAVTAG